MRFARNAKVFRGQLDMAPFVSVFFLLLAFEALTAVIRTPGAPARLSPVAGVLDSPRAPQIEVLKSGEIRFGGHGFRLETIEVLRADLQRLPRDAKLRLGIDPAAPKQLREIVVQMIRECGLAAPGGEPIQLPLGSPLTGVAGRAIAVAIDFAGQLYFNDQPIQESAFKSEVSKTVRQHPLEPPPTLVLWADREVPIETMTRLAGLAGEAGIKNVIFAMRQEKPGAGKPKKSGKP